MLQLANSSVTELFSIPESDWKAVNKRVGAVMALALIEDEIKPYLPAYGSLKESCSRWQMSTFPGLIKQSVELATYASKATGSFTELKTEVDKLKGSEVPPLLKGLILLRLKQLNDDTANIVATFDVMAYFLRIFLNDNKMIDIQMEANKDKLDIFWAPLGKQIGLLENGIGKVTGVWSAIADDIRNALDERIIVGLPFILSLNLEVAVRNWKTIQSIAEVFAGHVEGQVKYWFKPFED